MKRFIIIAALLSAALSLSAQDHEVRFFAHRGGRSEFEENTLETFKQCNALGMNGFETDVRLTADGKYVISHDANMKRMYDKEGIIEELTLKELKTYRTKGGSEIMTLDELLDFLKDKKGLYIEFEMKVTDTQAYPQEKLEKYCDGLYKKVMKKKPSDACYVFTSFDTRAIKYMATKYPQGNYMFLTAEPIGDKNIALAKALGATRLAGKVEGTCRKEVDKAHKEGLIVSLWPGTSTADFMLGVSLGADYLCTDVPQQIMNFTSNVAPWINQKH